MKMHVHCYFIFTHQQFLCSKLHKMPSKLYNALKYYNVQFNVKDNILTLPPKLT